MKNSFSYLYLMAAKLILSRKGFDSGTGGKPSPIVAERLVSLPIPQAGSGVFYEDLVWDDQRDFLSQMQDLGITYFSEAHLDPDLEAGWKQQRPEGWRPAFGQTGAAATHLREQGVGAGDLFLFFGWFRLVDRDRTGKLHYRKDSPDLHVLYGYLEVETVLDLNQETVPDCYQTHPHHVFRERYNPQGNQLYIAKEASSIWPGQKGAGVFPYAPSRVLSTGEGNRSVWKLPGGFFQGTKCRLTYHENRVGKVLAGRQGQWLSLQSVARGQEFVCSRNGRLHRWLQTIEP